MTVEATVRRRHIRIVPVLAAGLLIALGAAAVAIAGPAYAELTTDSADCQGEVVITGDDGTDTTLTQDTEKVTVDAVGSYSGTGSINGGQGGEERSYSGALKIDLPAPVPDYGPGSWSWSDDASSTYATTNPKKGDYDLPSYVPRGFYVPLVATHDEEGKTVCVFEGEIKVAGDFTDSPISIGAAVATVVFGILTTMAGVARKRGV
jgi:hypothetical protein